jgi:hypothetical protein
MRDEREGKKNTQISQLLVALMLLLNKRPAGDRRTPEQQGHRSCRGGVRCRGEGDRAIAGGERMGGRKEEKGKKKGGKGRRGCRPAGHFQNCIF